MEPCTPYQNHHHHSTVVTGSQWGRTSWPYRVKLMSNIKVLQLRKGNRCLHEVCHDSLAIYILSIYQPLSEQLAELPTILDTFYWCSQYHQQFYRVGGQRQPSSHKVMGKGYVFTKNRQMASIGAIFTSTYYTKQLNLWQNSSTSCVVNYSWLSAC